MLDRIRSSFNGFEQREVRVRDVIVFLGVIAVIAFCISITFVISQLSQPNNVIPTPVFSPTTVLAPTPFSQALDVLPTATSPVPMIAPTVVQKLISEVVNTPNRSVGDSCIYCNTWINNVATPIPDGGFSEYLNYSCDNGYWDIGVGDWLNSSGDWGNDGSFERAFIKFNGKGVVIDRVFFDLHGNKIPGPIN